MCPLQGANEDLNFEEQILEAAKSIAAATKSLVQSARATQRELVSQGKLGDTSKISEDSLWSEGLVSCVSSHIKPPIKYYPTIEHMCTACIRIKLNFILL